MNVNRCRIAINVLAALALVFSAVIRSQVAALAASLACLLAAVALFYMNIDRLSNVSAENPKLRSVRFVTAFNVIVIIAIFALSMLVESGRILPTEAEAKRFTAFFLAVLMVVFGNVAPRLPFNRYTGLRLPWTVRDEETWIVAHRILGYISLPLALLCCAAGFSSMPVERWFQLWFVGIVVAWVAIPGVLSGIFYWKKYSGRI